MSENIIAIDEVGRGALAGPIVAAAVLFQGRSVEAEILAQVKDSKLLSPARREQLFLLITRPLAWTVSFVSNRLIDQHGIQWANVRVVEKSAARLAKRFSSGRSIFIADYVAGAYKYQQGQHLINFYKHGDRHYPQIAAASIIAKVWRDRLMGRSHKKFPQYGFDQHKGYGTKEHLASLEKYGPCILHRRSFLKN